VKVLNCGVAICVFLGFAAAHAATSRVYHLESSTTLKGANPHWDYLALDAARGWLFINRRADGVTVFDTRAGKVVGEIAQSAGANATALIPEFDRGYTTNGDGSTTVFTVSTLATTTRIKLGDSADAGFYEPKTKQIAFMMGDEHRITFLDVVTNQVTARLPTQSEQLEAAAPDGAGGLFVAERDRDAILRIDAVGHRVVGEWTIAGCRQPTGLAFDRADQRLFIGCRGATPVLAVLRTDTGATIITLPIGRGNDGVIYDAESRRVFTSNGIDANLVVFDQNDPDHYIMSQAVTTRPIARTLAFDPGTKKLYTVTAEGMVDPSKPVNEEAGPFYPNSYFTDTFTVLTYAPR